MHAPVAVRPRCPRGRRRAPRPCAAPRHRCRRRVDAGVGRADVRAQPDGQRLGSGPGRASGSRPARRCRERAVRTRRTGFRHGSRHRSEREPRRLVGPGREAQAGPCRHRGTCGRRRKIVFRIVMEHASEMFGPAGTSLQRDLVQRIYRVYPRRGSAGWRSAQREPARTTAEGVAHAGAGGAAAARRTRLRDPRGSSRRAAYRAAAAAARHRRRRTRRGRLLVAIARDRSLDRLPEQTSETELMRPVRPWPPDGAARPRASARTSAWSSAGLDTAGTSPPRSAMPRLGRRATASASWLRSPPSWSLLRAAARLGRGHAGAARGVPARTLERAFERRLLRDERGLPRGHRGGVWQPLPSLRGRAAEPVAPPLELPLERGFERVETNCREHLEILDRLVTGEAEIAAALIAPPPRTRGAAASILRDVELTLSMSKHGSALPAQRCLWDETAVEAPRLPTLSGNVDAEVTIVAAAMPAYRRR